MFDHHRTASFTNILSEPQMQHFTEATVAFLIDPVNYKSHNNHMSLLQFHFKQHEAL